MWLMRLHHIETARALIEAGHTRQAAADALGVSRATIHRWQAMGWEPLTTSPGSHPRTPTLVARAWRQKWSGGRLHRAMLDAGIRCSESQARRILAAYARQQALEGSST